MKRHCLLICTLLFFALTLHARKCGHLYWSYNATTQTLSITGQGEMKDFGYGYRSAPWSKHDNKIKLIIISHGVTSIGAKAFQYCKNLTSITIPNSVTRIGDHAFQHCTNLTSITIPNSVTTIENFAFWSCTNLTSITIPNSVTTIERYTFQGCSSLTSITIPNSITTIEKSAFWNCTNLTSITIPNSITRIEDHTFENCTNLTSITIPNSVTSIGMSAFAGCSSLTSITIPNSVTKIENSAFERCSSLTSITIPDGITSIESGTFEDCTNLTSITIPKSVYSIGWDAFANCTKLTYITTYSHHTNVHHHAFRGCNKLTIYYPTGLRVKWDYVPSKTKFIAMDSSAAPSAPSSAAQPPLLTLVNGSLIFADASNNNCIDADEQNTIRFKIVNNGKGSAKACKVRTTMQGNSAGISVKELSLPEIAVGQTYEVQLPVRSSIDTQNGKVAFSIEVSEPNGWGVAPFEMIVATRAYEPPLVQVVDYAVSSASGKIQKMEPFTLTFNVQNTKFGDASDVQVNINLPNNVYLMDGNAALRFAQLKSGEAKTIRLVLAANNNFALSEIPVNIQLSEKHGKFAQSRQLPLALNQTATNSVTVTAKDNPEPVHKDIRLATIGSAVDKNIPTTKRHSNNTFAVIIANEQYQQVAPVPYALNDGAVFRQYCEKTLGIPAEQIHYVQNATGNNIRQQVNWLKQVIEAYHGNAKIIFYYAGHGVPDEQSRTAFLLPVDGNGSDPATGYRLDDLYAALGEKATKSVTILLDACFSGAKREEGMLASARGVAIKVKKGQPVGNMVVFSAATGDETAYPNHKEGHGMFTYYLLKKLQETAGDVTYRELGDYICEHVKQQSIVLNGKTQTPTITHSVTVGTDWQQWTLK